MNDNDIMDFYLAILLFKFEQQWSFNFSEPRMFFIFDFSQHFTDQLSCVIVKKNINFVTSNCRRNSLRFTICTFLK